MLASDQSASEDDIDELLVSDHDLLQFRDQDEDLEENITEVDSSNESSTDSSDEGSIDSSDDARPLSELLRGKGSDGIGLTTQDQKLLVPTQCVLRLIRPIEGSNKNVTADNWFSSIELIDELAKRKLTYVGTMKKNKREIPSEFQPQKNRDVQSTLFGFTNQKTICSYVPKKNRAVILVSSMHHGKIIDEDTKKPEIILYYNTTKGGVDEADKKCSIFSSSRRTRRWPMVIFYRTVDLRLDLEMLNIIQYASVSDYRQRRFFKARSPVR
ncbi:unnamed protein product [Pieris brassicae]|uniref:PiggyBac transposable element-derived protein domain-containing protein n=1 Tax=Pieris brassicae TaxID=7116 RepID=A0A9P0TVV5_PIEBR|nr:unnamed protein product [Pieris brassicae]